MRLKVITAPDELITVAEAALFLRVDDNGDSPATYPDESVIEAMITAARQWCEEYLRRAIGVQTLELVMDNFPSDGIVLLRPPVVSVTSITYTNTDGDDVVIDSDEYIVSANSHPGEIRPVDSWPGDVRVSADSVRVRYQTGYYGGGSPATSEELPKSIRTAILMRVADLYQNREAQVEKPLTANATIERLLSMYRLEMGM